MDRKKAVFVLGSMEYKAVRRGDSITNESWQLLDQVAERAGVDATIVFASVDPLAAGKNKSKIGMAALRKDRGRVLDEIGHAHPDFVMCFGPVASACVFGKGNLVEGELLRRAHYPLGEDQPPVYVTFGMENVRYKAGLAKWLALDIQAAVHGWGDTEWGDYTVLLPDDPEWNEIPRQLTTDPYYSTEDEMWLRSEKLTAIGYDLETYPGLDPWHPDARIRMAVVSDSVGRAWVVQATGDSRLPQWIYDLIEDPEVIKAGSNIPFDYKWHRRFGHRIVNMWDTSTTEHIIDESNPKKDLKSLTFKYVPKLADYSREQRDRVREAGGWEYLTDEEQYQYAGGDGEASIGAYVGQAKIIQDEGLERPHRLFHDLLPVLSEMQHHGAAVDLQENLRLDALYETKLAGLRQEIVAVLGPVNIDSPTKLAEALKKAVPGINLALREWRDVLSDSEDEELSTKREVLERESHRDPIISKVLEYRKYRVRWSTFITGIREKHAVLHSGGHFIHPNFNTSIVETYRLSSSHPNGQNIPRKDNDDPDLTVKQQFVSRFEGGQILEADQSQIELRFAAWLSQDEKMLEAIASGEDIHTAMASIMLDKPAADVTEQERYECKHRTFLILYGGGAAKLARDLKIPRRRAQRMIDEYFATFSGLKDFIDRTHRQVRNELQVETVFGFRRHFLEPEHWDSPEGWTIQRQAFNTLVQNGAACVTYCSMIWLQRHLEALGLKSKLFLQVHDSMLIDVAPGELEQVTRLVKWSMEHASEITQDYGVVIDVPLKCDVAVGPNWGETKELVV